MGWHPDGSSIPRAGCSLGLLRLGRDNPKGESLGQASHWAHPYLQMGILRTLIKSLISAWPCPILIVFRRQKCALAACRDSGEGICGAGSYVWGGTTTCCGLALPPVMAKAALKREGSSFLQTQMCFPSVWCLLHFTSKNATPLFS